MSPSTKPEPNVISTAKPGFASCPRCDYDLSGLVASWSDLCPLHATCSECGVSFDVANVMSPRNRGPRWSFEHQRGRPLRRWIATSWRTLWPSRFCRELRIDHRIAPVRLFLLALLWLAIVHICYAAVAVYSVGTFGPLNNWASGWSINLDKPEVRRALLRVAAAPYIGELRISTAPFSFTSIPIFPIFLLTYLPAALMPVWMLILGTTLRAARVRRVHLCRGMVYTVPAAALAALLVGAFMIGTTTLQGLGLMPRFVLRVEAVAGVACIAAFPAFHTWWWRQFIAHHLYLRHAWATAVLMQVISLLVVVLAGVGISIVNGPF